MRTRQRTKARALLFALGAIALAWGSSPAHAAPGIVDKDRDGYSPRQGDCDDANKDVHPGATEVCNSIDDNCDGQVDEGLSKIWYKDADGDGYGNANANATVSACAAPAGYVATSGDCNDSDASVNPAAAEVCNGADDNCDGHADEGLPTSDWFKDADGDGYGGSSSVQACTQPAGYVSKSGDCNDADKSISPGATETCNGVDDNCNGQADEGLSTLWYKDSDGDGYGGSTAANACSQPAGYVTKSGDCDDTNKNINPGAVETCNGIDDNCNGQADEGLTTQLWYKDADGDGYGGTTTITGCSQPAGFVAKGGDCNDTNKNIYPGAAEVCNDLDDNCNGQADEGLTTLWYKDADGDGYGGSTAVTSCTQPAGYVSKTGDCNDADKSVNPAASETCNGLDDNCNGAVDEGLTTQTWYKDADGDGYGSSTSVTGCSQPAGYVSRSGDCNDADKNINPGAVESCNGADDNCNGSIDEGVGSMWYRDADGDGYGTAATTTTACSQPSGYVSKSGDCDDTNKNVNPAATETCNGVDDNCNGQADEGLSSTTWYKDADGDGYGTNATTTTACTQPSGYVAVGGDCNDANKNVNPAATETCNGIDDNCNGQADEGLGTTTWYKDSDADGYGTSATTTTSCTQPSGYVAVGGDCNDANAKVNPGATEICNQIDDDCDGQVDDGAQPTTWYRDADGDGYGTSASTTTSCSQPSGYVAAGGDCDDTSKSINPGATEVCNSIDDNCSGTVDEGLATVTYYLDSDGDGYGGAVSKTSCSQPAGYVTKSGDCDDNNKTVNPGASESCNGIDDNCSSTADEGFDKDSDGYTTCGGDCNDNDKSIHPNAAEVCDSKDNNCNGTIDEGLTRTYYKDGDGDTYGDSSATTVGCTQPTGYVTKGGDCNDLMNSISPAGFEICDGQDDDCNSLADTKDTFDVTSGDLATFDSACSTYDREAVVDVPYLKVNYTWLGQNSTLNFYDGIMVGGHTPGVKPPSGWPSTCIYFDKGDFWWDPGVAASTYAATMCFNRGSTANTDTVNLSVVYSGITLKGTFTNDATKGYTVYYSAAESTATDQVWYINSNANTSGIGYSATMEVHNARAVLHMAAAP